MKKTSLQKDIFREIKKSKTRFISIMLMVALGSLIFVALNMTGPVMRDTIETFVEEQHMYDAKVSSLLGLEMEDQVILKSMKDVEELEFIHQSDYFINDGSHLLRIESLPEKISIPRVVEGTLPTASGEIALDSSIKEKGYRLGDRITFAPKAEKDETEDLKNLTYTVVAFVESTDYLFFSEKGSSKVGDGTVDYFALVPPENFQMDTYAFARLLYSDLRSLPSYGKDYEEAARVHLGKIEDAFAQRPSARLVKIKAEAEVDIQDAEEKIADAKQELSDGEKKLRDARKELDDGIEEYYDGKETFEDEIAKAEDKIRDGEKTLRESKTKLEDGRAEYRKGKAELEDNREKLLTFRRELDKGKAELDDGNRQLIDGQKKIDDGRKELADNKAALEDGILQIDDGIEQIDTGLLQIDEGLRKIRNGLLQIDANKPKIDSGLAQLDSGIQQVEGGIAQIDGGLAPLESGIAQLKGAISSLEAQKSGLEAQLNNPDLDEAQAATIRGNIQALNGQIGELKGQLAGLESQQQQLLSQRRGLQSQLSQLKAQRSELIATKAQLEKDAQTASFKRGELQRTKADLEAQRPELLEKKQELEAKRPDTEQGEKDLQEAQAELNEKRGDYLDGLAEYEDNERLYATSMKEFRDGEKKLEDARIELEDGQRKYDQGVIDLKDAKITLDSERTKGLAELEDAFAKIQEGEEEYRDGLQEYQDSLPEADEKIADGEKDIQDAKEIILKLKVPNYSVTGKYDSFGYVQYVENSYNIDTLCRVFPVLFFLIALLVSLTTMTRMVDEQRTLIGTLKALGYSNGDIISKYLIYGSTSGALGALLGIALAPTVTRIIFDAYSSGFVFSEPVFHFNFAFPAFSIIISLLCTGFAAFLASRASLKDNAAQLMRPKTPAHGNRIFMERITPIWSRLRFLHKVTARNIFRYKKRMLMTIVGVAGCTSLLLLGFGIKDSVANIIPMQYNEIINYDAIVVYNPDDTRENISAYENFIQSSPDIKKFSSAKIDASTVAVPGKLTQDVTLITPLDATFNGMVNLRDRVSQEPLIIPDDGAVISEKLADFLELKPSDTLTFKDSDGFTHPLKIASVTENYAGHYIYISPAYYSAIFDSAPEGNATFVTTIQEDDAGISAFVQKALEEEAVVSATNMNASVNSLDSLLDSLDLIVLVIILASSLLVVIVLYNLTNINISERIRELSTIKVLGFYPGEVTSYVYRETLILTFIGIVIGFVLGRILHLSIITFMAPSNVMMVPTMHPKNLLMAAAITLSFSLVVMVIMHRKLQKIDMIEALKAVE